MINGKSINVANKNLKATTVKGGYSETEYFKRAVFVPAIIEVARKIKSVKPIYFLILVYSQKLNHQDPSLQMYAMRLQHF